ncbi:MAG: ABC transporter permease, partial [Methylococcales bacterium]|nr:ABC transporter permease [Methylococcales bacterium]
MSRLIYKEFRQLLPIGWLWLAVILLGYLAKALTSRFDEETFSGWCEGFCDPGTNAFIAVFTILFSLVTAWSLFPREHDESTIDFLRALPVSRPAIYLAKVCAAWLLLCLVNLFSYGLDMTMLSTNPESIGGRFYPQVWFGLLWRDCVFAFVILSHGVVLSWFRTTGLVIYAIYLLLLMIFESQFGTAGLWSVFRILSNEYAGSVLIVDKTAIAVHVLIAILLLLIGYRLWNRSESSRAGGKVSSRGGKLLQGFFVLAGFLVLAAALIYRVGVGTGDVEGGELAVTASGHYRFVYNVADAVSVDYVQTHAEQDLKKLGEILGVTSLPNIRVDLTATSEHAAGLAKWKKIQMDMTSFNENISQRRVLSHESTHVLQAVESDRALSRYFGATRFFIEGMAQYTSFIIVPEQQRRTSNWEIAAVAWDRQ